MKKKGKSSFKLIGVDQGLIGVEETVNTDNQDPVFEEKVFDKEDFNVQLEAFKNSDFSRFVEDVNLKTSKYIIKVFRYQDPLKSKSSLLAYDMQGKLTTVSKLTDSFKITNIAKILYVGSGLKEPKYQVDEIVMLPQQTVTGFDLNPVYVQALQYSRSFGGEQPIVPPNCPEKVPSIQAHWRKYMYTRPDEFTKSLHEIFEFCIPEHEIL